MNSTKKGAVVLNPDQKGRSKKSAESSKYDLEGSNEVSSNFNHLNTYVLIDRLTAGTLVALVALVAWQPSHGLSSRSTRRPHGTELRSSSGSKGV